MAKIIESFVVTCDNSYGFYNNGASNIGSITGITSDFFGSNFISKVWWYAGGINVLRFEIAGHWALETPFDWIEIGGTKWYTTDPTFTARWVDGATGQITGPTPYSHDGQLTAFEWDTTTNPFAADPYGSYNFYIGHDGFIEAKLYPNDGQSNYSFNDIHQEAGGSSGTSFTLNDTDVRNNSTALGIVTGTGPSSGTLINVGDCYYPPAMDQPREGDGQICPINQGSKLSAFRSWECAAISYGDAGNDPTSFSDSVDVRILQDGTHTYIYCVPLNASTWTLKDPLRVTSSVSGSQIIGKIENIPITAIAMQTTSWTSGTYTSTSFGAPSSGTHLTTNNLTTFTNTSTNTYYGRKIYLTRTYGIGNTGIFTGSVRTRIDLMLRATNSSQIYHDLRISYGFYMDYVDEVL